MEDSSTETSFAPMAGGRITRPCSIPGTTRSCIKTFRPVAFAGNIGTQNRFADNRVLSGILQGSFCIDLEVQMFSANQRSDS